MVQTGQATAPIERITIESEEQWMALRKRDVTASTIAALWGMHPYETLAGLHALKSGVEFPKPVESSVMRRGRALERVVADEEVARLHPEWKITKASDYWRDPQRRIGATPDFYIHDEALRFGVLQTKTVASSVYKRTWGEDQPPFWITLQLTTELMLVGADFGMVAALVVGDFTFDIVTHFVPRHVTAEKRIREAAENFWLHVDSGVQPKIDYERDGPLLAALFPRETPGKVIDLRTDNRILQLLEERESVLGGQSVAEDRLSCINTEIKSKMEDAEAAIVPGWRVTFKQQHRKEHTVKASSFRVLRATRDLIGDDR